MRAGSSPARSKNKIIKRKSLKIKNREPYPFNKKVVKSQNDLAKSNQELMESNEDLIKTTNELGTSLDTFFEWVAERLRGT